MQDKRKYLTLFIVGLEREAAKHLVLPEYVIRYFRHYVAAAALLLISVFAISFVIFSNYNNVRSENSKLLAKLETMQKETEVINSLHLRDKLDMIDRNLARVNSYLRERGVFDGVKSAFIPYGNYNIELIDYYHKYTDEVYRTLRSTPLGYPYEGEKSSDYGYRRNPFGGAGGEFHSGVDFKGEYGDPIFATADGYVRSSDWYGGYGNAVVIEHTGGLTSLYGHLSKVNVNTGQFVKAGEIIGFLGSTGRSTGPHIHYEIRKNEEDIDPSEFFSIN